MSYRFRWSLVALSAVLFGCSSGTPAPPPTGHEPVGAVAEAVTTPTTVTVTFPAGATIGNTVMSGSGSLLLNVGATVGKAGDNLTVASFGSPTTTVTGLTTINGSISSVGPVVVQTLGTVTGSVLSTGTVTVFPGGTVRGAVTAKQAFGRIPQSWTVNLPSTNQGSVTLALGSRSLAPGAYGDLTTLLGTTLSLRSGTYFFTSFNTLPASTVKLDESGGPVIIYVTGNASPSGAWAASGGKNPTNLLFVSLGKGEVNVGSPLAGTVVAPNAEVDLLPVGAPHVGQVFAKQVDLAVGQTLLLGGFDWSYFCPLGDSDGDGVNDCTDQCPLDPLKTTPGVCACGVSEKDSDGDGIPDCVDQCPNDPTKSVPGQCGCGNSPQPAGTACNDGICSGVGSNTGLTCNGAGQCGNPSACAPDPSCVAKVYNQFVYWICPGPATWSQAMAKCDGVAGQTMLEIDSRQENAVLADFVKTESWTGANDQGTSGTWTWAGTSVTGKTFYTGGATVPGAYSNWGGSAPGDNVGQCGSFAGAPGTWSDKSCSTSLAYVCKRSLNTFSPVTFQPIDCGSFGGSLSCAATSPSANCVQNDPNLVDTATLKQQVDTCLDAGCTQPGDPGCAQCTGAATVPPPGSTCRPYSGTLCGVSPGTETRTCDSGAQCASGQICAATVQTAQGSSSVNCTLCDSRDDAGNCNANCGTGQIMHCGTQAAGCELPYDGGLCREVVLCAPDGSTGILDPRANPGTNLNPVIFDASGVFEAGAPPTPDYPQDPACPTPPCTLGPKNGWCSYLVPTSLPNQDPGNSNPANSGSGGLIQFDFDPNLSLHFQATPLALGESNFDLTASASLTAGATFNLPVVGKSSFEIVDALAILTATRCQATTGSSHLKVFGIDFLPTSFKFDTDGTPTKLLDKQSCEDAVSAFETIVDRAKKSLKDAQTLVTQYNASRDAGLVFPYATPPADAGLEGGASLCQLIASDPPAGFPAGDCAHETPEATINRFIQFYTSQVGNAANTEAALALKELTVKKQIPVNFLNNTEQQTLFSQTFLIGPIPCLLQVQSVEGYGLGGDLNFTFNGGALLLSQNREQMADITGSVTPYANAGISLFVGVGFDIGIASASAGVEGIVTLGNIDAPITAGAGLDIAPAPDPRPIPPELAAISNGIPIVKPMQYQFFLDYNYGAAVDINKILGGYLAARLEISFLFWSASWTQEIVDFGDGFSLPRINLVSGDGTTPALGSFPWATVQMPTPFVSLQQVPVPSTPIRTGPDGGPARIASLDNSQVEKFFYDSLCTCIEAGVPEAGGSTCFRNGDCCPTGGDAAVVCFSDPALGGAKTCEACRTSSFNVEDDGGCPPDSGLIFCGTTVPPQSCNQKSDCCQTGPNGNDCTSTDAGKVCVDLPGRPPA